MCVRCGTCLRQRSRCPAAAAGGGPVSASPRTCRWSTPAGGPRGSPRGPGRRSPGRRGRGWSRRGVGCRGRRSRDCRAPGRPTRRSGCRRPGTGRRTRGFPSAAAPSPVPPPPPSLRLSPRRGPLKASPSGRSPQRQRDDACGLQRPTASHNANIVHRNNNFI